MPATTASLTPLAALPLDSRALFLRLDANVPQHDDGSIASDARLRAAVPVVQQALAQGAKVALASHFGEPKKRERRLSLLPVFERLSELCGIDIVFCPEVVGDAVRSCVTQLRPGQAMALENLRFEPGEKANDPTFVRALAAPFALYATDAFAALHRPHASVVGLPQAIGQAAIGPLIAQELSAFEKWFAAPRQGSVAIVGGAKVADKLGLLRALVERVEVLMVGGAMAHPFLAATGHALGASLLEHEAIPMARSVLAKAREKRCQLILPCDHVAAERYAADSAPVVIGQTAVPDSLMALDIGPQTRAKFAELARRAQTVFWNGPLGVAQWPSFAQGSHAVAQGVAACPGLTVVGGGDSLAVLQSAGLLERVRHASTGGGAALALVEHGNLPGLEAIARVAG